MARAKDAKKRDLILKSAKTLFSQKGFFNASISDIVKEVKLPVGTIYTYFKSKEEIVRAIVDEGWEELHKRLKDSLSAVPTMEAGLNILVEQFLPELFKDIDLINIFLSETAKLTGIEDKVEELTDLIFNLIRHKLPGGEDNSAKKNMKAALIVYFLGILNAVKLCETAPIGITSKDIMTFLKQSIRSTLNIDL